MWAVVGLGNPGRAYSRTRHNVGFMFIKRLADGWGVRIRKRRLLSKIARVERNDRQILLGKPQTYMNHSGEAVKKIVDHTDVDPERLIVVYDDFDLPLGELRVRKAGGAGTHMGMKSILQELGTSRIPRIRIGIGPLTPDADPVDFVLSPFREEESPLLDRSLAKAREALELILDGKIDEAMNRYN